MKHCIALHVSSHERETGIRPELVNEERFHLHIGARDCTGRAILRGIYALTLNRRKTMADNVLESGPPSAKRPKLSSPALSVSASDGNGK